MKAKWLKDLLLIFGIGWTEEMKRKHSNNVARYYASDMESALKQQGLTTNVFIIPAGEKNKKLLIMQELRILDIFI